MISQETKERIREQSQLPTHDDCESTKKSKQLNALERFIYDQEPVDDGEWREQLRAAIAEAREAEATRAAGLYDCLLKIRHNHYTENAVDKKIDEALTKYNNPVNK